MHSKDCVALGVILMILSVILGLLFIYFGYNPYPFIMFIPGGALTLAGALIQKIEGFIQDDNN